MNGPIRRVSLLCMLMFLALMLNSTWAYVFRTEELASNPANRRVRDAEFGADRGDILVGNTSIAASKPVKDRFGYLRTYPQGPLYAPITGYYTFTYGGSALEQTYSPQLSGTSDAQALQRWIDAASGKKPTGASIQTTLDARAQQAAYKGLGKRPGAVVAIDYKTGEIRAMVSTPSFDPNQLATHDLAAADKAWKALNADPDKPMTNRAAREIYPPGSTFKLVVSAAALEAGYTPETQVDAPDGLRLPGSTAVLNNAGSCGGTRITLMQALQVSCNTAFANIGLDLGDDAMRAQAEKFGFGSRQLPELNGVASRFPANPDRAQTAMSAIGAYDVAASPLQMAMVSAAIANNGVLMEPHLVSQISGADLSVLSKVNPRQLSVPMTAANARALQDMMVNVVQNGTGQRAQISGVRVGGKTGTAVTGVRLPYAWFVAFADKPNIAVAVFVQDAGVTQSEVSGSRVAGPVAKAVIEAMR